MLKDDCDECAHSKESHFEDSHSRRRETCLAAFCDCSKYEPPNHKEKA